MDENTEYIKNHFPPLNQSNNKIPEELSEDVIYTIKPITDMNKKLSHKHLFIWYKTNIDHNSLKRFIQGKRRRPLEEIIIADFTCDNNTITGLYVNFGSPYRTNNLNTLIYPGEYEEFSPCIYTLNSSSIRSPLLTFIWYNKSYSDMKYDLCTRSKLGCCKSYIKYIKNNNTDNTVKQDPKPETSIVNEIKKPIPANPAPTTNSFNTPQPITDTSVTNWKPNTTPKNTLLKQNNNSPLERSRFTNPNPLSNTLGNPQPQQKQIILPRSARYVGDESRGGISYKKYYDDRTYKTSYVQMDTKVIFQ